MNKIKKIIFMVLVVLLSLMIFSACSNSEKWKVTKYSVTDKDGTHNMMVVLNSGVLELFKDGKCTLTLASTQNIETFSGTWSEHNDVITTVIPDFNMSLVKSKNKLSSTKTITDENGGTIVTEIEFSK